MIKRDLRAQIVIVENGQYILLKHHHKQENRYFWGLPGGGQEENETEQEAAIREAKEETGLDINLLPFRYEVSFGLNERLYKRKVTFVGYPVKGVANTGYDPEEDLRLLFELVDIKWHPIKDIENIDEVAREDILPVKDFLENNNFIKRAGALVYKEENQQVKYLLISMRSNPNRFTLPQGHVEEKETYEQTAIRETEEEAGVKIDLEKELGYFFYEDKLGIKQTYIYLAKYYKEVKCEENRIVKWVSYEESQMLDIPREARRFIEDFHKGLNK